jgi:RNA polymerase sigma-70 factor (ECF subfamily)
MQESFLTAFSKLGTFKAESKIGNESATFGSWLKRIVINKSLTQLKKNKQIQSYNDSYVEVENVHIVNEESIELDYNLIKVEEILNAIKKLKNNYSIVLNLSLIEGYDNDEIAQILETNNQSIRTTISRAKRKLRKVLNEIHV